MLLVLAIPLIAGCDAFSWGTDNSGQLGDGVIGGSRVAPAIAAAGFDWREIKAGWDHTCGVRDDGTLWCWGRNNYGQLGQGYEDIDSAVPLQVGGAADWVTVSPGSQHTCGIRAGGQLWCWGRGTNGQLGDGLSNTSWVPVRVGTASDWTEVAAGGFRFSCGLRGVGDLFCWGINSNGQLGVGDYIERGTPTPVGGSPWRGLDAGTRHACAITVINETKCWGDNGDRQIRVNSSTQSFPTPTQATLPDAEQVEAGLADTCVIRNEDAGALHRTAGCIGGGVPDLSGGPTSVVGCSAIPCETNTGTLRFKRIDLSVSTACGILHGSDAAVCWGMGSAGQIGDGSSANRILPAVVLGGRAWWSISTGKSHTIGLEMPPDTDGDGVLDPFDNCPEVANPSQADSNNNGIGDLCEPPGC